MLAKSNQGKLSVNQVLSHLKKEKLLFHINACRIYNAAAYLKNDLHEIIDAAEPDIISLGGTKNGLLAAEAVVIFNQDLQEGYDYLQKTNSASTI